MSEQRNGTAIEWLVPIALVLVTGWVIWHMPAFILDWGGHQDQLAAHFARVDVAPDMPVVMGTHIDIVDLAALLLIPVLFVLGVRTVRRAPMEFESWRPLDRLAVFIGRITMMLIVVLCCVMLFEVFVRYVLNNGTLWANEMSLWLAGFIFLFAGLYAMQQRSHIRIFLIYDMFPRWLQHVCDVTSTLLIVTFAFFLIYGGYGEAFAKYGRWELFGSAFNPPIPATLKPTVLLVIALVAIQSIINLISDWNEEPVIHTAADDIDQDEIERLKKAVGAD